MRKILYIIFLGWIMASCHTPHKLTEDSGTIQTFTIPFKLTISGNMSANGKAYMQLDKDIYLSIRFMGMEVVSFYANSDSVFLYDKLHHTLIADKLGINPNTNKQMSINELQDFLFGVDSYARNFAFRIDESTIFLDPGKLKTLGLNKYLDQWNFIVRNETLRLGFQGKLTWDYNKMEINPSRVQEWKKPRNPKNTIGIKDLGQFIINAL